MKDDLVSICIPVYNGANYLHECLDSAIAQDYPNTEIIIVDDGSTDRTLEIANEYAARDSRISVHRNEKNLGLVGNWNRCIGLAKGEWIKFLFQDDFLSADCISRMMNSAAEPRQDINFIVCNRNFIFDDGVPDDVKSTYENNLHTLDEILGIRNRKFISVEELVRIVSKLVNTNFIGEPTVVMFRKNMTDMLGFFSPDLVQICDLEYWLRISLNYGLFYIPEDLAHFRVHNKSMSSHNRETGRYFVDKIVLTHDLLTKKYFERFRKLLSATGLFRIRLMYKVRIHEVMTMLMTEPANSKLAAHYQLIRSKYPEIKRHERASLFTKFIFYLVTLRRKSR